MLCRRFSGGFIFSVCISVAFSVNACHCMGIAGGLYEENIRGHGIYQAAGADRAADRTAVSHSAAGQSDRYRHGGNPWRYRAFLRQHRLPVSVSLHDPDHGHCQCRSDHRFPGLWQWAAGQGQGDAVILLSVGSDYQCHFFLRVISVSGNDHFHLYGQRGHH